MFIPPLKSECSLQAPPWEKCKLVAQSIVLFPRGWPHENRDWTSHTTTYIFKYKLKFDHCFLVQKLYELSYLQYSSSAISSSSVLGFSEQGEMKPETIHPHNVFDMTLKCSPINHPTCCPSRASYLVGSSSRLMDVSGLKSAGTLENPAKHYCNLPSPLTDCLLTSEKCP